MSTDSGTPRTDEWATLHGDSPLESNHAWGYCRQLEREAAALRADRDALVGALRNLLKAHWNQAPANIMPHDTHWRAMEALKYHGGSHE